MSSTTSIPRLGVIPMLLVMLGTLFSHGLLAAGKTTGGHTLQVPVVGRTSFASSLSGEIGAQGAGVLAANAGRALSLGAQPILRTALGQLLPAGASGAMVGVMSELVEAAAFKIGLDVGQGLGEESGQKPWNKKYYGAEVVAAGVGWVAGSALLRPVLGTFGGWLGGWVGWTLAENLVEQHRQGESLSLGKALGDIDYPELVLQMLATEGAALVAPTVARALFGSLMAAGGVGGLVALLGVQIGLTALGNAVVNKLYQEFKGVETEVDVEVPVIDAPGAAETEEAPAAPAASVLEEDPQQAVDDPAGANSPSTVLELREEARRLYQEYLALSRSGRAQDPQTLDVYSRYVALREEVREKLQAERLTP